MCIPFLDFTVMLLDFQDLKAAEINGVPCFVGILARVNYALSGGVPDEDSAPQFTYRELMAMFRIVNYLGFLSSHFFILENPPNEIQNAKEAVTDYATKLIKIIVSLSPTEREMIHGLAIGVDDLVVLTDSPIISNVRNSPSNVGEVVDFSLSDDENVVPEAVPVTPNKSFSFNSIAPPSVEERDTLLKMVLFNLFVFVHLFNLLSPFRLNYSLLNLQRWRL
jgi:hypothetical protein